jgi:hypothetical protein
LPDDCKYFEGEPDFDPVDFEPADFKTEGDKIIADFKARTGIFYTDFNDAGDGIKDVPSIDTLKLRNAITILKGIIQKTVIPLR